MHFFVFYCNNIIFIHIFTPVNTKYQHSPIAMKTIVARNLKLLRDSAGYTQQEVANLIGIERGEYANYESSGAPRLMPFDLMRQICDLYGVPLNELIKKNSEKAENEFVYAFRVKTKNYADLKEIANFKKVISNYLKLCAYKEGLYDV